MWGRLRAGIKPRVGYNVASVLSATFNFLKHLLCDEQCWALVLWSCHHLSTYHLPQH